MCHPEIQTHPEVLKKNSKENFIMTQVDNEENSGNRNSRQFLLLLIFFQTVFIILFGFFVKYDENWNDDELTRKRLNLRFNAST